MKAFFVTGTDTGVGKTFVATALVAAFAQRGRRVAAMKPIETGCDEQDRTLIAADAAQLAEATGRKLDRRLVCPCRYRTPASPSTAASLEGRPTPSFDDLRGAFDKLGVDADLVVVEGAGGLLVPVDERRTMADLAAFLGLPLVVVARTALGTINHTLLTLEAARHRGLPVAGVVFSASTAEAGPEEARVPALVAHHGGARVLGVLPYARATTVATRAALAEKHLDLQALWDAL